MLKNIEGKVFFKQKSKNKPHVHVFTVTNKVIKLVSESVKSVEDRRLILSKKKLCFNCTGTKYRASDCRSNKLCLISNSKHHTSICDKNENVLLITNSDACVYPLVTVSIEGIECCALVDTTAGAFYVSSTIVSLINRKTNKKPISTESK